MQTKESARNKGKDRGFGAQDCRRRERQEELITAPVVRDRREALRPSLACSLAQLAWGQYDRERFAIFGSDGDGTDMDGYEPSYEPHRDSLAVHYEGDASDDLAWSLPGYEDMRLLEEVARKETYGSNGANVRSKQEAATAEIETIEVVELLPSGNKLTAEVTVEGREINIATSRYLVRAWIHGDIKAGMEILEEQVIRRMIAEGYKVKLNGAHILPLPGVNLVERTWLGPNDHRPNHEHIVWINAGDEADTYTILTAGARYLISATVEGLEDLCEHLVAKGYRVSVNRSHYIPRAKRAEHEAQIAALPTGDSAVGKRRAVGGSRRGLYRPAAPKAADAE